VPGSSPRDVVVNRRVIAGNFFPFRWLNPRVSEEHWLLTAYYGDVSMLS